MNQETNSDLRKRFCQNLKAFREIKEIRQIDIAAHLHIDRSTYSYYEIGKVLPNILCVFKIAQFYSIPMDTLFEENPNIREYLRTGEKRILSDYLHK